MQNTLYRKLIISIFFLFTVSCQSTTTLGYQINRGIVGNYSGNEITDVKVTHLPTKAMASFSNILSDTTAEIGFAKRELLAKKAIITWVENGIRYQRNLTLPEIEQSEIQFPQQLVYSIYSDGVVGVDLARDSSR